MVTDKRNGPENVLSFFVEGVQIGSTTNRDLIVSQSNVNGTYGKYSQLCFPNSTITLPTTVQFLTHGLGCDRSYWNLAPSYSYVDYAAEQGYTTFLYDRLGVGLSDHPDPIQIVQAGFQVAIAHELVQLLRTGGIANHTFEHVVGVGHSFSSFHTLGLTVRHPDDLDAGVLIGFSASTAGTLAGFAGVNLTIASQNQLLRFVGLSNGDLTSNNILGD